MEDLPGFIVPDTDLPNNTGGNQIHETDINDLIFTSDASQNISIIDQRINNHKEHLTERDLDAARRELDGEVVALRPDGTPFDHVGEVRDSQRGLKNIINTINNRLSHPETTRVEREQLQDALSDASRLLDRSEQFVPPL